MSLINRKIHYSLLYFWQTFIAISNIFAQAFFFLVLFSYELPIEFDNLHLQILDIPDDMSSELKYAVKSTRKTAQSFGQFG